MLRRVVVAFRGINASPQYTCRPLVCRFLSKDTGPPVDADDVAEPPIPVYKAREGEPVETQRARLLYQSRKRGMLENGLLLSTFASRYLKDMNDSQLTMYDDIINKPSNDWDIFYWQVGKAPTPPEYDNEVMDMMKKHAKNEEKEERFIQPAL